MDVTSRSAATLSNHILPSSSSYYLHIIRTHIACRPSHRRGPAVVRGYGMVRIGIACRYLGSYRPRILLLFTFTMLYYTGNNFLFPPCCATGFFSIVEMVSRGRQIYTIAYSPTVPTQGGAFVRVSLELPDLAQDGTRRFFVMVSSVRGVVVG